MTVPLPTRVRIDGTTHAELVMRLVRPSWGQTRCLISWSNQYDHRLMLNERPGEVTDRLIDCLACIALESS